MKGLILVIAFGLFSGLSFGQGFVNTAPKNLTPTSQVLVNQGTANSTGVLINSYHYSLVDLTADVSNTSTTETDIFTHTSAANRFNATGDKVIGNFSIAFSDATATVTIRCYFAGGKYFDTGAITLSGTGVGILTFMIERTGSTTARGQACLMTGASTVPVYSGEFDMTGITFSNTNIVKFTAQAGGAGGGSGDITGKVGTLTFASAAQ